MAKSCHKVGVIGLGHAARAILPRLAADPRFDLTSCWDPSDEAVNAAREAVPDLRAAFSVDEVFRYADAIYLATPPSTHLGYIKQAVDAGKALFCEAPLSIEPEPAVALGEQLAARERPAILAFNFIQALAPALQVIQELMAQPKFGKLLTAEIEVSCPQWPREQQKGSIWPLKRGEGGVTREIVSHQLFVLRRLLGSLEIETCRIGYPPDARFAETSIEARLMAGQTPVILGAQCGGGKGRDTTIITFQAQTEGFRLNNWFDLDRFRNGLWHGVDFGAGSMSERVMASLLDELDLFFGGQPHHLATYPEALEIQLCVEQLISVGQQAQTPKKAVIR